ncbi:MAG: DUF5069 domain-containing protein [Verrucomicrobiota bacterium JB023]|nr:DUF5069 domain-containing protein [Verrucomicrobiota bacterium JB023]
MTNDTYPCSPREELDDLPHFPRLCEKIRLEADGRLHHELHANLGKGMDLWVCQFLGIDYDDLKFRVLAGDSNESVLSWAKTNGVKRDEEETKWFRSYMHTRGFRDDLADKLSQRCRESGFEGRDDILTFMDYIDADEGRL